LIKQLHIVKKTYAGKRFFDIVFSIFAIVLLSPIIMVVSALLFLTQGPIFYKGKRAGLYGEPFYQFKFCSMIENNSHAFTSANDKRITPIGRIIRKYKIDEIPQFFNVLIGDMSVVGPRPEDYDVVMKHYNKKQFKIFCVKPGLTCTQQIKAYPDFNYIIPKSVDPNDYYLKKILPGRLEIDLQYLDDISIVFDISIIFKTIYCILFKS
tara:strand:- start:610 stop:1236 length:627 start_codon:yes stop_codon:yes gene_type:complete